MELSLSTTLQQSRLEFSQLTFNSTASSAPQEPKRIHHRDRMEFSPEARRHHGRDMTVEHSRHAQAQTDSPSLNDFLSSMISQLTGARVDNLQDTNPEVDRTMAEPSPSQQLSGSAQQTSLSLNSSSLSIAGTINTSDGTRLSFALDLHIMHASASTAAFSVTAGPEGTEFSFAGSAAELTGTSFSFSLSTETPDGTMATGIGLGTFSLKDELKEIRQTLKPLVKDFLDNSGMPSDRRSVNQLLHALA